MASYTAKKKTTTEGAKATSNVKAWNDCITGVMTLSINAFGSGEKTRTVYSTRIYRKMKESEEYLNHYVDVKFTGENKTPFTADEKKVKINVKDAFISLDYWVDKESGEIGYKPTIYVKAWERV